MNRDDRLLVLATSLLALFVVGEAVVAIAFHSLALLADAGHGVTDVVALAATAAAARLARRPATGHWTFGLARAEVLSAAVNGVTLGVIALIITAEAIHRLITPSHPNGTAMIAAGVAGLAINLAVVGVLSRTDRKSMNVGGAMAHVVTDAFGFAASIAAGAVIVGIGWHRADPVASLLLVVILLRSARSLLRDSGRVLLEAAPSDVDLALVREHLLDASYVVDVHDLHVWTVTSGLPALSVHVVINEDCFTTGRAPALLDELQACLAGHFDVAHSTFQLEPAGHSDHEPALH
ncbi:MAG TPA: cation diffusion facilitator family transporter [Mycobacteriales bacterium]|nr:cation diffusion facilitator family transporter [Mycobacteriales bacterium]